MLPPNEKKKICKNPVEIPTLWKNPVEREREREREEVELTSLRICVFV